jgi:peptide/nickel transport system substrate-binding protein
MKKVLTIVVLLALSVSLFAGCTPVAKQPVTLVFAKGDAVELDPADVTDGESITVTDNIFEGLVRYKAGSTELEPCLATSWDTSTDGLTWTFHLRKNVKFQDGTPFNADAVVFSYERQRDVNNSFHQYGKWEYWGWCFSEIAKTEKVDDLTVKITLSHPFAPFLSTMAMFTMDVVSPTNCNQWKDQWFAHPVGTGPFSFVEWVKGDHITLAKNNNYWGTKAQIDTLIFKVIADSSARYLALQKGEVQGMEFPNPDDLPKIAQDTNLVVLSAPGLNVGYLAMNMGKDTPGFQAPFADVRVRQAINYAINKADIVNSLYKGTAVVAKNPIPPTLWGYNDAVVDYEYNPTKAKELLKEAGYPNGFKTNLWAMPVSRPYMFDPKAIATAIQADLKKVGITAEIVTYDWSTYLAKTEAGEHSMALLGWTADYADPDDFLYVLFDQDSATVGSAGNIAFYRNPTVHTLNIEAQQTTDLNQRITLYKQVQQIVHDDAPWVPLAYAKQILVFASNVKGFVLYPTGDYHFDSVTLETTTP